MNFKNQTQCEAPFKPDIAEGGDVSNFERSNLQWTKKDCVNPIEDNGTSLYDEKQIKAVNELKKKTDIQFIREDILHEENVKRRR